jgi:hypothetical protein
MVTAFGGWLIVYDNISALPNWFSDGLCRLATGGGYAGRALYSNDQRSIIHAERPVILNGVDEFVRRDDLADRCVFLHLPAIAETDRRSLAELWRAFRVDYPAIFGGILDAVAGGLRELPSVNLSKLPRMADFARFGEAVALSLGWPAETFLSAYGENRQQAASTSLEDSLLARVIMRSAALGGLRQWTRSPADMLEDLSEDLPRSLRASTRWPKSPRGLSNELHRIAPQLRTRGIWVTFGRTRDSRLITISAGGGISHSCVTHK